MVGHQNRRWLLEEEWISLGRQGMVGHQNGGAQHESNSDSLGRQGMVGHQNWERKFVVNALV